MAHHQLEFAGKKLSRQPFCALDQILDQPALGLKRSCQLTCHRVGMNIRFDPIQEGSQAMAVELVVGLLRYPVEQVQRDGEGVNAP